MERQEILYFEKGGKQNTDITLRAAKKRALELGIKQIVIATTHGYTALKAAEIFKDTDIELIAVGLSFACTYEGWDMKPDEKEKIEEAGVKVVICQHSLSRGVAEAFEGVSIADIIAHTLYGFSQGMKVAVEISIMAAESGVIPIEKEVIAVAGTGEGADTAIVLTPSYAFKYKDLKIHEILCKPRHP